MLKQRVFTAIIALVCLLIVLFIVPPVIAELLIAAVIIAGAWEWSGFLGGSGSSIRLVYVAVIGGLMTLVLLPFASSTDLILKIALVWWLLALIWTFFFPTPVPTAVRWLGGALVLVPMYAALLLLYRADPAILLFALLIVWVADSGAYFAGKTFGRVKLALSISPGKTWEGVIGGLVAVVLLILGRSFWIDTNLVVLIPFGLAVASLSIIGDLTVSIFKRSAGIKDSGTLFPGHGGVLDRIDSVASALPLFAIGLSWAGLQ